VESLVNKFAEAAPKQQTDGSERLIDGNQVFIIIGFPLNSFQDF
jgi:hypothetical protein